MKEWFRHPTFEMYAALENIFVNFINNGTEYEEGMQILKELYEGDIHVDTFLVELSLVTQLAKGDKNVLRAYMPLLAVNPSTSTTSEKSFSLARRIKTCNRSKLVAKRFSVYQFWIVIKPKLIT